jgi:hypothetical protein
MQREAQFSNLMSTSEALTAKDNPRRTPEVCRFPELRRPPLWLWAQIANSWAGRDAFVKAAAVSSQLRAQSQNTTAKRGMNELEEDLFTLNAIAPSLLKQVPALFEESVRESLSLMLGMKASKGAMRWFRDADLGSRPEVFERLASRYGDGASPLQIMIDQAFKRRVHELLEQLT